jgi:peptide-methionine (R)-S-oxide reductase
LAFDVRGLTFETTVDDMLSTSNLERQTSNFFIMNRTAFIQTLGGLLLAGPLAKAATYFSMPTATQLADNKPPRRLVKINAEWKKILTADQYAVTREAGTERAGTWSLLHNKQKGVYACICCKEPLFSSETKFESGTGWPSFYAPLSKNVVKEKTDNAHGMSRTEVECAVCDAHLGHVFKDGPQPTGLRYCMNGVALEFVKK